MSSFSQAAADFQAAQRSGDPTIIRVAAAVLQQSPEAAHARQVHARQVTTDRAQNPSQIGRRP